ncbi:MULTISPECIES: methyltransferase domain-containing protein [unclassified Burkholderia]|uniref:methyltransferase domain-containing protein n=1 Tax=unclassified Burkholderia TaxID=2613784 RepID=UPI00075371B4|nr:MULTISPECIES: class I SAM-dependent methyltransferase [unclassified Burkholderia]AOI76834.1 hypothetical protein WS54_11445 [Burkholderia sp. NRF60-BP8]KVA16312.1 hypothetical protein WS54_08230 [Burkholderia sp. NRF60-BP8]KVL12326.1 hypothetical protein WS95_25285 [Burkholderia sp. MSMB1826]
MSVQRSSVSSAVAQDLTGKAILLEIGENLGILPLLVRGGTQLRATDLVNPSCPNAELAGAYLSALSHLHLVSESNDGSGGFTYQAAPALRQEINNAGYLLWGLMSCAPLVANAARFAADYDVAESTHVRDGEHVARTSRWMGETDFYPHAEAALVETAPRKIVDLGAGTCGLLMRCLRRLPGATGIGIDLSEKACRRARELIAAEGLDGRLSVVHAPIQSLVDDPTPLHGAELIHGGFVFHDLMPQDEPILDRLLNTFVHHAPAATLLIVDAVPFADPDDEGAFSTAFTFLHNHFMRRKLMTTDEWRHKLGRAGYMRVDVSPLGISGGRILRAHPPR